MGIDKRNKEGYYDPTAYEAMTAIHKEEKAKARHHKPIVFICSPLAGNVERNLENARRFSRFAVEQGAIPLAPHLLYPQFMDDSDPDERTLALSFGTALLSKCDEVWVFGEVVSSGMKEEMTKARLWGKLVRYFGADCEVRQ